MTIVRILLVATRSSRKKVKKNNNQNQFLSEIVPPSKLSRRFTSCSLREKKKLELCIARTVVVLHGTKATVSLDKIRGAIPRRFAENYNDDCPTKIVEEKNALRVVKN